MVLQQKVSHRTLAVVFVMVVLLGMASITWAEGCGWTRKADMLTARSAFSTSVVDGKIYAIGGNGGNTTVEVYDPTTDTWTQKTNMPTGRQEFSTSVADGKIYAFGGVHFNHTSLPLSTVEVYDPMTDTWTQKADMPMGVYGLSTSAVDDKIYAIGGARLSSTYGTVEEYDPGTDTWTQKADMPTARAALSTSVVNGKIYAIGGGPGYGGSGHRNSVEEYDPATDTWTQKAQMPTGRSSLSTSVVDGKIYAIGGQVWHEKLTFRTVEEYDPATDTWTRKADMLGIRVALSTSVVDGKIYAIGGSRGLWPWSPVSTVEAYYPAVERLSEGLISATETFGATWVGQPTPLEIAVELDAPLETTESLRKMSLDLSPLGIPSDLPLEHVGGGRYTRSITVTPLQNGHHNLPILVETTEGERYRFLTVTLDVHPEGDEYLYQDQMGSRWAVTVSAAEVDLQASDMVHGGSYSQAINLQGGYIQYGFEDPDGFSTFGYTGLEFWIHPGTASTEQAKLVLYTAEGAIVDDLGISLQPNVWQVVSIPLEDLELVDTRLMIIKLRGIEGTFYLDDVAFVVAEYGLANAAATPDRVKSDGTMQTLLTVQAVQAVSEPGALPVVTIDLTPIGGAPDAVMTDDGTGGDQTAADGIYSLRTTVDPATRNGLKDLIITSTDHRLRVVRIPLSVGVLPVQDVVLYQDQVEEGWTLGLYNTEADPNATDYVHSGSCAYAITMQTGGQMNYTLDDPDGLPAFGYVLEFWLNPGSASIQELQIVAFGRVGTATKVKLLPLVEQWGLSFEPGTWQRVSIPLEALELTDATLERLRFIGDIQGTFYMDDIRLVHEEVIDTAVEDVSGGTALPSGYSLAQNCPNPFNPFTAIAYHLPEAGDVTLTLYTITGQKVAVLVDGHQGAGHHRVLFDGSGFGSGVYFYRLEAGSFVEARRMVLLK